jgi:hypothetical protein
MLHGAEGKGKKIFSPGIGLEYSWKSCVIGEEKKKNVDEGNAFIV